MKRRSQTRAGSWYQAELLEPWLQKAEYTDNCKTTPSALFHGLMNTQADFGPVHLIPFLMS